MANNSQFQKALEASVEEQLKALGMFPVPAYIMAHLVNEAGIKVEKVLASAITEGSVRAAWQKASPPKPAPSGGSGNR